MVCAYYGKEHSLQSIKKEISVSRIGVTVGDVKRTCEKFGLFTLAVRGTVEQLSKISSPAILHWRGNHFVVLYKILNKKNRRIYYVADPAYGKLKFCESDFLKNWCGEDKNGIAIVAEPTSKFYLKEITRENDEVVLNSLLYKISKRKRFLIGAMTFMLIAIFCNWLSPIIFQKIVDDGVVGKSIPVVWELFVAQLAVFMGYVISNIANTVLLTQLNFSISIEFLSELLNKLIRLPLKYFETRLNTEFIQRFDDYLRLQSFLTEKSLSHLLSMINLVVFSAILCCYNLYMFFIFCFCSLIGLFWNFHFLNERKCLDYSRFTEQARNRNILYELINGMPDIKINNAQNTRVKNWEINQKHINEITFKGLVLGYKQSLGSSAISKICEIVILGFCSILTIESNMSIGVLISTNYILGQLATPLISLLQMPRDLQDAKISIARLADIQLKEEESHGSKKNLTIKEGISFNSVTFKYEGSFNPNIFEQLCVSFKKGEITAIVGNSGSGKTTLIKLLLGLYSPNMGYIMIDNERLCDIDIENWRLCCGAVLQDGYIFSGTIAENIALGDEVIDYDKVVYSSKLACIDDFIKRYPNGYNMNIGKSGLELSQGQKQRILIARAIYKDPQLLIFDEATSSLDTINERRIMDNLKDFFKGRTVIVVAHRLSTVVNADNIIFLENGKIAEQGTHKTLVAKKGKYYELIKNQLELEN